MRSHGVSTAQHLMRVRFAKVELAIQGAALQSIQLARSILTEALPHIYWSHRAMMEPNIKAKNKFLDKANECGPAAAAAIAAPGRKSCCSATERAINNYPSPVVVEIKEGHSIIVNDCRT